MSIEVNNVPPSGGHVVEVGGQARGTSQPPAEKVADTSGAEHGSRTDQVSLTQAAQQLRGLEQEIADHPVVDTRKVEAIKEALANGSYEIDSNRVAGKMMDLEKALGDLS